MAVAIDDKGRVIIRVVLGPQTWCTIVLRSKFKSSPVEVVHRVSISCGERYVQSLGYFFLHGVQREHLYGPGLRDQLQRRPGA